jgi:hypothetical protein
MWTTGIVCQKFHSTSSLGRLFEVSASASVEAQHVPAHPDADVRQAIGLSLTQAATQSENLEKEKNAAIQADTDRYDFNEWLNRAGWARHLKGLQRDWLLRMAQKPTYNVLRERESVKKEREREKEKKAQEQAQKKQQKEKEKQAAQAWNIAHSSQITPATTLKKQALKRKRQRAMSQLRALYNTAKLP